MANAVSPSEVKVLTKGQAGKFADLIVAAALKLGLPSEISQQVIENQGAEIAQECANILRARVDAASNIITRRVSVNRDRVPMEAIDATGRNKYLSDSVVNTMPRGEGEEVEVHFFKIGKTVSCVDLDAEYEKRGLKPADPYSMLAVNEADPAFADKHPNGTQWKDVRGNYCFAYCSLWGGGGRGVDVDQDDGGWLDCWWFAGLRK